MMSSTYKENLQRRKKGIEREERNLAIADKVVDVLVQEKLDFLDAEDVMNLASDQLDKMMRSKRV